MIFSDYHIGMMGAIKANADYNQVEAIEGEDGKLILFYMERGKEMAAIVDDTLKQTKTMLREIYDNPPEETSIETVENTAEELPEEPTYENHEGA